MNLSGGPFHRKIQLREDLLYRCYLGNPRTQEIIVLYDIPPGKPHHRHIRGKEEPYHFTSPEQLWNTFVRDVEDVLRGEL